MSEESIENPTSPPLSEEEQQQPSAAAEAPAAAEVEAEVPAPAPSQSEESAPAPRQEETLQEQANDDSNNENSQPPEQEQQAPAPESVPAPAETQPTSPPEPASAPAPAPSESAPPAATAAPAAPETAPPATAVAAPSAPRQLNVDAVNDYMNKQKTLYTNISKAKEVSQGVDMMAQEEHTDVQSLAGLPAEFDSEKDDYWASLESNWANAGVPRTQLIHYVMRLLRDIKEIDLLQKYINPHLAVRGKGKKKKNSVLTKKIILKIIGNY